MDWRQPAEIIPNVGLLLGAGTEAGAFDAASRCLANTGCGRNQPLEQVLTLSCARKKLAG